MLLLGCLVVLPEGIREIRSSCLEEGRRPGKIGLGHAILVIDAAKFAERQRPGYAVRTQKTPGWHTRRRSSLVDRNFSVHGHAQRRVGAAPLGESYSGSKHTLGPGDCHGRGPCAPNPSCFGCLAQPVLRHQGNGAVLSILADRIATPHSGAWCLIEVQRSSPLLLRLSLEGHKESSTCGDRGGVDLLHL